MITQVKEYIAHHKLLSKQSKIVVGLSGGPDSMVLIDVLVQLGYNCIAAHCNFHLRGDSSNRDAAFVAKWCKENDIALFTIDFNTIEYAETNNISIEMAARELRYNWFEELRVEQGADVVGVGHHQDDSVETIIINLIRGTGIKGLTGIPVVNRHIVRPLLGVSRQQIMDYCSDNELPYVIDHTNEEELYTRNILRLNVLPTLEKINPSVKKSIVATANNLKEAEKIYDGYIGSVIQSVFEGNKIDIDKLKDTYSPQSVLFEILSPMGFTPALIEDVSNNLDSISGKMYYADDYRLLKDRDYLVVSDIAKEGVDDSEYLVYANRADENIPFDLTIKSEAYSSNFKIQKNKAVLQCDFDKLTFPLTLRKWENGDWFVPFGMKGRKKLSDFFSDNKMSLFEKEETWVLLSDNKIVWIVDRRADDRFRITDDTKTVYIVSLCK